MPNVQFENITQSLLRLPDVIKSIPDVLRNPAANPLQAAVLLAMALVLALIILLSIVLAIMRSSVEDEYPLTEQAPEGEQTPEGEESAGESAEESVGESAAPVKRKRALSWLTVTSIIILVFIAVWITAGITTSNSQICTSCHFNTAHSSAPVGDQHAGVSCVLCHETGGPVAHVTVNLATRVEHVILAQSKSARALAYGRPVASDGCLRCHRTQISATYFNRVQSVRMSHKEPLAAGAQCVDCHPLTSGAIGIQTVGMSPCLRCHDGSSAKAACSECHVGDPSGAIRSTVPTNAMASAQVPNPECTGCHKDMTKCNACHGISMPHSAVFKQYAHARAGALDIWYNGGKTCAKCHYPGHNDCVQGGCHATPVSWGHPNPAWATLHRLTSWSNGPKTACSCHQWNTFDHNGMIYCQICHPKKPANAVP